MFARILYTILGLIAVGIFAYAHFNYQDEIAVYALIFVIPAVAIFVLAPQVNWWYYNRRPPKIDRDLKKLIQTCVPFYRGLSPELKEKFEQRVHFFIEGKDFQPIKTEKVGEDLKAAIAISGVQLTFQKEENWMFEDYEKCIIYPHPFPTPQFEAWHITEHYEEDGVLLFSSQHLMHGFFQPRQYLNIAMYELACIYLEKEKLQLPFNQESWEILEKISGFEQEKTKAYVGLENLNVAALALTFYFTHRVRFEKFLPKEFAELNKRFERLG